jgi:uncharacterized protein YndB with AHSA1/START domain
MPNEPRSIDFTVSIAAPADAVWRALTDPAELVRWFPLQAQVVPGVGGSVTWSWDDRWTWTTRIEKWEPGRLLRLVQDAQRPFDADGEEVPASLAASVPMILEFTLESDAGRTKLRLVHSGFGHGAAWDDELDGVRVGWNHELRILAFYLERHAGKDRHMALAYLTCAEPRHVAWQRVLSDEAFALLPATPVVGEAYSVQVSTRERFHGIVRHYIPEHDFTGTIHGLDDGIFRVGTHRAAGRTGVQVAFATYDPLRQPDMQRLGAHAQQVLEEMFGARA